MPNLSLLRHRYGTPSLFACERAHESGASLRAMWRTYAASCVNPYSLARFTVRFAAWRAFNQEREASNHASSLVAAPLPLAPTISRIVVINRGIAFIDPPGTALQVRGGGGDGSETRIEPAGGARHGLQAIIRAARGASLTIEALRWLMAERVGLHVMSKAGEAVAMFANNPV
jgi:hypothetical protein